MHQCASVQPHLRVTLIPVELGLKSACSVLVLGELGVTLIVTPPEFIVAVGKRNSFCASWAHHVLSISFTTSVNPN